MITVFDAAAYVLKKRGPMTAMKMQKLLYYCQAWSLVWDDKPLFPSRFEAWANGPVAPEYFYEHQGERVVTTERRGDPAVISESEQETINAVLDAYGDKDPQWLSDQTHRETPWITARAGLADGQRGNHEISHASLVEYYGKL